jgi:hypothetical protein
MKFVDRQMRLPHYAFVLQKENKENTKPRWRWDTSPLRRNVIFLFLTYDKMSDFTVYVIQLGSSIFTSS